MSSPVYKVGDPAPPPLPRRSESEVMARWQGEKPVVSILCPTYQHVDFIEDALRGFLGQDTDFPFEILVRDDASTDGTAEIVRDYAERYPSIIRAVLETENRYPEVKARQVLGPMMRGEFIAVCEGDDYWIHPGFLHGAVHCLQQRPNSAGILGDGLVVSSETIKFTSERQSAGIPETLTQSSLLRTRYLPIRGLVLRAGLPLPSVKLCPSLHSGDQVRTFQLGLLGKPILNLSLPPVFVYRFLSARTSVNSMQKQMRRGLSGAMEAARALEFARLLEEYGFSDIAEIREREAFRWLIRSVSHGRPFVAAGLVAIELTRALRGKVIRTLQHVRRQI